MAFKMIAISWIKDIWTTFRKDMRHCNPIYFPILWKFNKEYSAKNHMVLHLYKWSFHLGAATPASSKSTLKVACITKEHMMEQALLSRVIVAPLLQRLLFRVFESTVTIAQLCSTWEVKDFEGFPRSSRDPFFCG